jgi:hypothetical protein
VRPISGLSHAADLAAIHARQAGLQTSMKLFNRAQLIKVIACEHSGTQMPHFDKSNLADK